MRNWWIRKFAGFGAILLSLGLAACGGTSSSPGGSGNNGQLSLSITAPSTYAANQPESTTITLKMYNTSNVNGTNLIYTVPNPTNYTGQNNITPYPNGLGNNCQNIAAGQSCQFTVVIAPYANPGSFTVDATPSAGSGLISKVKSLIAKALNSNTISVTANLSLVQIPANNYQFYILPESQTINAAPSGATTAYVSVLVESTAVQPFTTLKLVDQNGNPLTYTLIGTTTSTESYAVNSYSVSIPANTSVQQIQVYSYNGNTAVCNTLSSCSNDATVTLAPVTAGILQVQPYAFSMESSYPLQVITLTNTGNASLSGSLPTFSLPFGITSNNCGAAYTLEAGASCTFSLTYTAGSSSGESSFAFSYNNGSEDTSTTINVPYTGNGVAVINFAPESITLTSASAYQTVVFTNTGNATATNFTLPALTAPIFAVSSTCSATLTAGESCSYIVGYTSSATESSANFQFSYNNGTATQESSIATSWGLFISYISVYAGGGSTYYAPFFNVPALSASINEDVYSVAVDNSGNLYIADAEYDFVYKVTNGLITSIAGISEDDSPPTYGLLAESTSIGVPTGLAVDTAGNVYVSDYNSSLVYKITESTGIVTKFAGTGTAGAATSGVLATSSQLYEPYGVGTDKNGNVYIADTLNYRVEKVGTNGILTFVTGNGSQGVPTAGPASASQIGEPEGVAVDNNGNIYIADGNNYLIEKIDTNESLSIYAGVTGSAIGPSPGPATQSSIGYPYGVAADSLGNIYIADQINNTIYKVDSYDLLSIYVGSCTTPTVQCASGTPTITPTQANITALDGPYGVAINNYGIVYIADEGNGLVESVN